jgi:hypothetical protein
MAHLSSHIAAQASRRANVLFSRLYLVDGR